MFHNINAYASTLVHYLAIAGAVIVHVHVCVWQGLALTACEFSHDPLLLQPPNFLFYLPFHPHHSDPTKLLREVVHQSVSTSL